MKQFIIKNINSSLITQISTSWELSDSPSFSNIIDSVYNSIDNMYVWVVDISQLPGTTLYVRAKRHFDNGEDSDWIPYSTTLSNSLDANYVISEHAVEQPMLINSTAIYEHLNTIHIELSPMLDTTVPHKATNYIIKDIHGNIKYSSLYNTEDLTYHSVDLLDNEMSPYEQYILYASYINENNVQSQFLEAYIIPEEYKVYPTSDLSKIIYNLDYELNISNPYNVLYNLQIKNTESGEIIFERNEINLTSITIPQFTLFPNKTYELMITETANTNNFISTFSVQNANEIYKSYDSLTIKQYDFIDIDINIDIDIANYFIKGLGNNTIITYSHITNKYSISNITKYYIDTFETYLTSSTQLSNELLYIEPIGGNKVIVISKDDNTNKLIFSTLTYNINTYILSEYKQDIIDITFDINKISTDSFVFNGYNRSIYFLGIDNNLVNIYRYILDTSEVLEVMELPVQEYDKYYLFEGDIDTLYYTATGVDSAGDRSAIYEYNIKTESNIIKIILPIEFKNSDFIFIKNRDNIVYGLDTTNTSGKALVFNTYTKQFTTINEDLLDINKKIIQLENFATFIKTDTVFKYTEMI